MKMDNLTVQSNRYNKATKEKKTVRRKKAMKKMLMFLLGMAFALNVLLVIGMVSESISPRQAFYTITDEMMNGAYRFKRGWQLKNILP